MQTFAAKMGEAILVMLADEPVCTLQCTDGSVQAHDQILSVASPVLREALQLGKTVTVRCPIRVLAPCCGSACPMPAAHCMLHIDLGYDRVVLGCLLLSWHNPTSCMPLFCLTAPTASSPCHAA